MSEVAVAVGYSQRQLQRRSTRWFGYGPKHLASVCRLQRALSLGRAGLSASDAAVAAGYADQAHLARDARRLAGATFTELVEPAVRSAQEVAPGGESWAAVDSVA